MKKTISIILIIIFALTVFVGCADPFKPNPNAPVNPNEIILRLEGVDKKSLTWEDFLSIKQSEFEIKRTNSKNVTTKAKYQGVTWNDLSDRIGAKNAVKVTLISSDGYEKVYDIKTLKTGNSLFAVYQDGKNVSKTPLEGQIWFCADESLTANLWSKYINKMIIE